jgi:glycine/D-amino acid oxidase-like deaminating enzyme
VAYSSLSFWLDSVEDDLTPRPPLPGDTDVDVCIVGGGYTGLWTAYYLAAKDPTLRIAVVEAEICGYGASGRNGGWCSALFPSSVSALARDHGRDAAVALHRALHSTVDEVGKVAQAEGIDCHYAKGGTVVVARTPVQLARAEEEVAEAREFGFGATTWRCWARPRRRPVRRHERARRHVHPALRGHPPGPAGAWAGPRGRAPRGPHL